MPKEAHMPRLDPSKLTQDDIRAVMVVKSLKKSGGRTPLQRALDIYGLRKKKQRK